MIRLRCAVARGLPDTMTPSLGPCANAVRARSISLASRTSMGRSSTPSDGASTWITPELAGTDRDSRFTKDRHSRHTWRDLLEQFQPFSGDGIFEDSKAGGVAAWPREALDIAGGDRVGDTREYDRHGAGRFQQRFDGGACGGQNDVRRESDRFGCVPSHGFGAAGTPAIVDSYILPDRPTRLLQGLGKNGQSGVSFHIICGKRREDADVPHSILLLRLCRERPRSRA